MQTSKLYLSEEAMEALSWYAMSDGGYFSDSHEAFDALDEMYDLVCKEDIEEGTYAWICDYAGGKFYTQVSPEDNQWFPEGI